MPALSLTGAQSPATPWRMVLSGFCASLLGIGLSRFAYTPLLPELVSAGWFGAGDAAYLGAANLAGYLAGALLARRVAARFGATAAMRGAMLLAVASFFACAAPLSFAWFFLWRLASGIAGGMLMVLVAPTILPHVPEARRGLAGGLIFTGVGAGIALSGTAVPLLLQGGLVRTWIELGLLALVLAGLAWGGWPPAARRVAAARAGLRPSRALWLLALVYALNALGLVPHMTLLVDFVARGLGQGLKAGAAYWVVFGLGAMAGPVLAGSLADRVGFRSALRVALALQVAAVGLVVLSHSPAALVASSIIVGGFVPGIVPLVLGRLREIAGPDPERQRAAWSLGTIAFAVGQAGGGYGLSFLFAETGSHALLFVIASAALAVALLVELASPR
ncbi:YbfB/YjiJ family MFS transporter [Roseococcus sp. YIM B11640]|uniref:YbfB/YjiJ family MFS transporter n=1 Tax=Roseococcus sp. YIM B11640 TaxID=3133973 RepID=UPI003C7E09E9